MKTKIRYYIQRFAERMHRSWAFAEKWLCADTTAACLVVVCGVFLVIGLIMRAYQDGYETSRLDAQFVPQTYVSQGVVKEVLPAVVGPMGRHHHVRMIYSADDGREVFVRFHIPESNTTYRRLEEFRGRHARFVYRRVEEPEARIMGGPRGVCELDKSHIYSLVSMG